MATVFWVVGLWLLVSVPAAAFFGWFCSSNRLDSDDLPIGDELPIIAAPASDHAAFGAVRIPA